MVFCPDGSCVEVLEDCGEEHVSFAVILIAVVQGKLVENKRQMVINCDVLEKWMLGLGNMFAQQNWVAIYTAAALLMCHTKPKFIQKRFRVQQHHCRPSSCRMFK